MFRRNETRTRGQLLRAELGESWDHALRAAGHAAGGVRATVGPVVAPAAGRVRGAAASGWGSTKSALAPLSEAAQYGIKQGEKKAKRARKPGRRRWPMVAGLVAGGAAVGGTAAYLVRRRRQQQWEDYQAEPLGATDSQDSLAAGAGASGGSMTGPGAGSAATPGGESTVGPGRESAPAGFTTTGPATAGSATAGSATAGSAKAGSAEAGSAAAGEAGRSRAEEQQPARAAESVNASASRNNRS